MKVRARVDQLAEDRIGSPQELPRLGIGHRGGSPPRPSPGLALRALGSKDTGHPV
jgi:hypothetical protein